MMSGLAELCVAMGNCLAADRGADVYYTNRSAGGAPDALSSPLGGHASVNWTRKKRLGEKVLMLCYRRQPFTAVNYQEIGGPARIGANAVSIREMPWPNVEDEIGQGVERP